MSDRDKEEVSDEMLMALADGELDSTEAAALRARIARDPDLAARHAVFSETAAALRAAFAQDEVPARLVDAVRGAAQDRDPDDRPDDRKMVGFPSRAAAWPLTFAAALAASLALGIGLGWGLRGDDDPGPTPSLAQVAQAVSGVATGGTTDVAGLGAARVLGSFETERGLCRLIAVEPLQGDRGRFVGCHAAGHASETGAGEAGWEVALSVTDGSGEGFSPASDTGTQVIDTYLDAVGAGAALDPETEAEMLRRGPD